MESIMPAGIMDLSWIAQSVSAAEFAAEFYSTENASSTLPPDAPLLMA
jgi:hypothetical protein